MNDSGVHLIPILIDDREKLPWALSVNQFSTDRKRLVTGDYTIVGYEETVAIERKSLGDFVGTVIHDWIRFRKELKRLSSYDTAAIVVEANVEDVLSHKYDSEAAPLSVMGRAHGIFLDHGVPVFFWGPRLQSLRMAEQFLWLTWKRLL